MGKPRILYFINGFNRGGAELGLLTMLEHGFLEGCETRVLAIHEGDGALRGSIEALLPPGAVTVVSKGQSLKLSAMLGSALALWRLIREFRPAIAVLSLKQANIIGRCVLLAFPRIHCVAFEHIARLEQGRLASLYAFLLKRLSFRVDETWADCTTTLVGAQQYYTPADRTTRIIPLFVSSPDQPRKERFEANRPFSIVTCGRLINRKRTEVIVAALAKLRAEGADVTLTVFGDGPRRRELEGQTKALGLEPFVQFRGFQSKWFETARDYDAFLHLSDEEGFCIVVAEAMMVGLPVIASPVGGVPEYMSDGQDGLYARKSEPEAIAQLLRDLMSTEERRKMLGLNASNRIHKAFSPSAARAVFAELNAAFVDLARAKETSIG